MQKINRRKEFFDTLNPYFIKRGFKFYNHFGAPSLVKFIRDDLLCSFYMNFPSKSGIPFFSRFLLSHFEVEDIILEIDIPSMDLDTYRKKDKDFLHTIEQIKVKIDFKENKCLETVEDYKSYAKAILKYAQTDGKAFIEKYSYLPNILIKMDELENKSENWMNEGLYWRNDNGDSISGSAESYFRVLIISKLCNDPMLHEKIKKVDVMFSSWNEEWNQSYEQLKIRLESISPKYNLE